MIGTKEGKRTSCLEREEREIKQEPSSGALSPPGSGAASFPSGILDIVPAWCPPVFYW